MTFRYRHAEQQRRRRAEREQVAGEAAQHCESPPSNHVEGVPFRFRITLAALSHALAPTPDGRDDRPQHADRDLIDQRPTAEDVDERLNERGHADPYACLFEDLLTERSMSRVGSRPYWQ
jgi:hypothetical protein